MKPPFYNRPIGCGGCLIVALSMVVALIVLGALMPKGDTIPRAGRADRSSVVSHGAVGVLGYPDGGGMMIWLASTGDDFDPMLDAQNAAGAGGPGAGGQLVRLAEAGRVQSYPVGTRVRVISSGWFSQQVEVLDSGFPGDRGRTGWVQAEFVRPGG